MRRIILASYCLLGAYFAFTPAPATGGVGDKWLHIAFSGVLAALIWWNLDDEIGLRVRKTAIIAIAAGILVELIQSQIPGRHASLLDILANLLGVGLALAGVWLWLNRSRLGIHAD